MKIKPVGHRILVKCDTAELETEWGFQVVTDKRLENAAVTSGVLVGVGSQAWKAFGPNFTGEPWAQVGDRVFFAQYSGKTVIDPDTGEEYKLMNDDDITAVVAEEDLV